MEQKPLLVRGMLWLKGSPAVFFCPLAGRGRKGAVVQKRLLSQGALLLQRRRDATPAGWRCNQTLCEQWQYL